MLTTKVLGGKGRRTASSKPALNHHTTPKQPPSQQKTRTLQNHPRQSAIFTRKVGFLISVLLHFISPYKLLMSSRENQVTIFSLIAINTFRQGKQEGEVTVHEWVGNFLKVLPFCTDKAVLSVFTMKELGSGKIGYCLRSLCTVVLSEL